MQDPDSRPLFAVGLPLVGGGTADSSPADVVAFPGSGLTAMIEPRLWPLSAA